jgi:hypothetical protein
MIDLGYKSAEAARTFSAQENLTARKARAASATTSDIDYQCAYCGRFFRAWIGSISHHWTHRTQSAMYEEFHGRYRLQ